MAKDMQIVMLASGSKGNAALISTDSQRFLVDVGISCRELVKRMGQAGACPEELDGVFLTHEHTDHVNGLVTFAKKYNVPIYASTGTWQAVFRKYANLNRTNCRLTGKSMRCGDVRVDSFAVSHDAAEPLGYSFNWYSGGTKCTYMTDTGFVTPAAREAALGSDALILEANHDVEMLKNGSYPYDLKQRILGTRGHLSNLIAAQFLLQFTKLPKQVILAHLSEQNNTPELALDTVRNILDSKKRLAETTLFVAAQSHVVAACAAEQKSLFD
ncbi:MBL fold metallo-hydrolase [uncultured Phascolarctobacterium sp.]|uniref:MBL fold metallo-hydrolase n=1 Tax=uncultured Phascolarctobacterium sp. TaxID=512296 RepID=UPI00263007A6|nr:MBL fold metallo-hydrolase [uncultured Phascolarctobacterium sp.]